MVLEVESGRVLVVRMRPGDKLPEKLLEVLREQGVSAGAIIGIGGLKKAVVGFFSNGRYERVEVQSKGGEILELASLIGNVAVSEGDITLHLHAVIGSRGETVAGHLLEAEVYPTAEIFVLEVKGVLKRLPDPETGLKLLVV